jgi:plastocyanin
MKRYVLSLVAGAGLVVAAACSGSDSTGPDNGGGVPAVIALVSGNGQRVLVGEELLSAFVVKVSDSGGRGVANVTVSWAVTGGGGSLSVASSQTASNGQATAFLTVGDTEGTNTVNASVDGLSGSPVSFTAAGVVPTAIALSAGNNQEARISRPLAQPIQVRVTAGDDGPVPGATVAWQVTGGGGSLSAASASSDADGRASVTWTLGPTVGVNGAEASVGVGLSTSFDATGSLPVRITVNIVDNAFAAPGGGDDIAIMLGDSVRWLNMGSMAHSATSNVTPTGGASFDSGTLGNGQSFTFVASQRGDWVYFCKFHAAAMNNARIAVQ